jgi:uncharacterized membrane protein
MHVGLILFCGASLLFMALGIPLWLRKVGPNYIYGFRVRATLEDPEVWYEANAYAGKALFYGGLITLLFNVALYFFAEGLGKDSYAMLGGGAVMIMVIAMTVLSFIKLNKIFKEREARGKPPA